MIEIILVVVARFSTLLLLLLLLLSYVKWRQRNATLLCAIVRRLLSTFSSRERVLVWMTFHSQLRNNNNNNNNN